jgi:hypothetical protein
MGLCCAVIVMGGLPNGQWVGEDCSYPYFTLSVSLRPSCEDDTVTDQCGYNYA